MSAATDARLGDLEDRNKAMAALLQAAITLNESQRDPEALTAFLQAERDMLTARKRILSWRFPLRTRLRFLLTHGYWWRNRP